MMNNRKLALATVLAALTAGSVQSAPVQWSAGVGGNDHWYEVVIGRPTTWNFANTSATASTHLGQTGYLASITSALEQTFLNGLNTSSIRAWLGGTDAAVEGTWEWTSGEAFTYSNWYTGEPNNYYNEDYLIGWWNGDTWNDYREVHVAAAYIVEYNPGVAPVPLPAGLPLVLGALGLLGFAGRRRKTS